MWKEKFIKYLRYEKNYSPRTEISYLSDLTQFEEFVTSTAWREGSGEQAIKTNDREETEAGKLFNPREIDSTLIRSWIGTLMEQGLKPKTVNRKLSAVKSFFRYLKKQGVVE